MKGLIMAATKRTRDQRERDRARCADLYAKGWTQAAIAKEMGVAQSQVAYDMAAVRKAWRDSALRSWDELRSEQLAKIDMLEATYWAGYERSLKDRTRERVGQHTGISASGAPVDVAVVERTVEMRDGAIAHLAGVERCINLRCKLLGLNELERQTASVLAKAYSGFDFSMI
jgi:hypothetical protein